jgi:hypothetical protein
LAQKLPDEKQINQQQPSLGISWEETMRSTPLLRKLWQTDRTSAEPRWKFRSMSLRVKSSTGRVIATLTMAALACATAITAAGAVTFDEVVINPPLSATPVDLVASDETPGQEVLSTLLGPISSTPPGFISGTLFIGEPPSSTNEGTPFNTINPGFPPNTSDALTIISDLAQGPRINVFFISDGASPHDIGNFLLLPNRFFISEDGTLQDVSAFFGMPPGTVLVGSDVPEPSALILLATGLAGLLGYGGRRRRA